MQTKYDELANFNESNYNKLKNLHGFSICEKELCLKKNEVIGFYMTFLSLLHPDISFRELSRKVCDAEFCKLVFNERHDDYGIDAIVIDDEDRIIYLYNAKHKKSLTDGHMNASVLTDIDLFFDELLRIKSEKDIGLFSSKTYESTQGYSYANMILNVYELLYPSDHSIPYGVELRFVSNYSKQLPFNSIFKDKCSKKSFDYSSYCLSDFHELISVDLPLNAKLYISNKFRFSSSDSSSDNETIIAELKLTDLIRITSKSEKTRNDPEMKIYEKTHEFNQNCLNKNVRGMVKKSKYNNSIIETLNSNPSNFFHFNNGITIIADKIRTKTNDVPFETTELELENFSIVNGGQTARSVYKFMDSKQNWFSKLSKASVLAKIVVIGEKNISAEEIAEFTNSQNPIDKIDLRSLDHIQIALQEFLEANDIAYIRKRGDTGYDTSLFSKEIHMSVLGQLIYSKNGNPHRASNIKRVIFDKEYNNIFGISNLHTYSLKVINDYYDIYNYYNDNFNKATANENEDDIRKYSYSNQKSFYILYMMKKKRWKIARAVTTLSEALLSYNENDIPDSRKLIKVAFKDHLDTLL